MSSSSYRKKVYTKFGDKGETSLLYGGRVSKNSVNTEAYGITDEAVSAMGLARSLSDNQKIKDILRDLQRELFTIAAELATDPGKYDLFKEHFAPVTQLMVDKLEEIIDRTPKEPNHISFGSKLVVFSALPGLCRIRVLSNHSLLKDKPLSFKVKY